VQVLAYAMISTNAEDRPEIGEVCMRASKMRAATASKRGSTSSQGASSSSSSSGGAGGERGDDEGREEKGGAGPVSASSGGSVSGSDGARQVSVAAAEAKHDDAPGGRGDKGYDDGRDDRARYRDRDRDRDREAKMTQDRIDRDGDSRTDSSRRPSFRQDGDDIGDGHGHSSKNGFKTAARAVDGGEQRGSRQSSAGTSDEPPRGSKDRPTGRPGGGDDSEDAEATQVNIRVYNAPGSGAEPNGGARRPSDREKRDKDKEKDKGGMGQPVYYPYNRDAESEKKSRTPEIKPYSRPKQLSPSSAAAAGGGAPRAGSGGQGSDAQARQ